MTVITTFFYTQTGSQTNQIYWLDYRQGDQLLPDGAVIIGRAYDQTLEMYDDMIPNFQPPPGCTVQAYWCGGPTEIAVTETLMSVYGLCWAVIYQPPLPPLG